MPSKLTLVMDVKSDPVMVMASPPSGDPLLGAKVVTLSDSSGYIYDEKGIDSQKLEWVIELKNMRRGRIRDYVEEFDSAQYVEADPTADSNSLWDHKGDCAFPSATQNEINARDA